MDDQQDSDLLHPGSERDKLINQLMSLRVILLLNQYHDVIML